MPTTPLSTQAEILLLCDLARLARLFQVILNAQGHIQTFVIDGPAPWPMSASPWDLMLIVFSKPGDDPLDMLRRAGLIQWVGRRHRAHPHAQSTE